LNESDIERPAQNLAKIGEGGLGDRIEAAAHRETATDSQEAHAAESLEKNPDNSKNRKPISARNDLSTAKPHSNNESTTIDKDHTLIHPHTSKDPSNSQNPSGQYKTLASHNCLPGLSPQDEHLPILESKGSAEQVTHVEGKSPYSDDFIN